MSEKVKLPPKPDEMGFDPNDKEFQKLCYQAWLELVKENYKVDLAQRTTKKSGTDAQDFEREKAAWANEYAMQQAVHNAFIEVAKGEVDRVTTRAELVQKVAAAISGIYVATLGLSFGLGEGSTPLPAQGLASTLFLGLAIFLATAYAGFITKPEDMEGATGGDLFTIQSERLNKFVIWARHASIQRRHLLQASIISLGFGVLFLPVPYLNLNIDLVWVLVAIGVIVALVPVINARIRKEEPAA